MIIRVFDLDKNQHQIEIDPNTSLYIQILSRLNLRVSSLNDVFVIYKGKKLRYNDQLSEIVGLDSKPTFCLLRGSRPLDPIDPRHSESLSSINRSLDEETKNPSASRTQGETNVSSEFNTKQNIASKTMDETSNAPLKSTKDQEFHLNESNLESLIEMGFDSEESKKALINSGNDIDLAIEYMFQTDTTENDIIRKPDESVPEYIN